MAMMVAQLWCLKCLYDPMHLVWQKGVKCLFVGFFFFMPSFVPTAPLVVAQRARLCFLITVCTISSRKVLGSIIDRLNKREGEI